MRVDTGRLFTSELSSQTPFEAIVAAPADRRLSIVGPPGSGKTTALAQRAARLTEFGRVAVICPTQSSCRSFRTAAASMTSAALEVETFADLAASWMREQYAAAGVSPRLLVGGSAAAGRAIDIAARGLLDLSWPMFRTGDFNLDLPFLARPDLFLDEAAALFRQLRRLRLTPDQFAFGCATGLDAFYGETIEAAVIRLRDPELHARLSRRASKACGVGPDALRVQRRAEADLTKVLVQLYAEYIAALPGVAEWCEEDVAAHVVVWLAEDSRAARSIARRYVTLLVDDAEDADPAVAPVLELLISAGLPGFTIAGYEESRLDAMSGRRPTMIDLGIATECITLPPRPIAPSGGRGAARRFADEQAEGDWLAATIADMLRAGTPVAEIAVLARSIDSAAVYKALLEERGVPVAPPANAFFRAKEIKDLLALAAIVDDPSDHAHLLRVLSSGLVGLSDASVWILCRRPEDFLQLSLDVGARGEPQRSDPEGRPMLLARNVFEGAVDHELPEEIRARLAEFRRTFRVWRQAARREDPPAIVEHLMDAAGFRARWNAERGHARRRALDDARRLVEAIATMHEAERSARLHELVRRIEDGEATIRPALPTEGAIVCEAIPAVKGRRWSHVFVAGVAHERFPRIYLPRAMAFSKNYGLLVRDNVAGGAPQSAKFAWFYAKFDAKARYMEQERKMLRYAVSRADRSASVSGFGTPPRWAARDDLLAEYGV